MQREKEHANTINKKTCRILIFYTISEFNFFYKSKLRFKIPHKLNIKESNIFFLLFNIFILLGEIEVVENTGICFLFSFEK